MRYVLVAQPGKYTKFPSTMDFVSVVRKAAIFEQERCGEDNQARNIVHAGWARYRDKI